ncbi:MAG: TIGR04190 family B12-binding domain/radical SAM domain protein [Candidatus Micrarchaeia archaeon]
MFDLVLIHAPSIYDFRRRAYNGGPISDVVPSTPIFEMYPMGYISFVSNLVPNGYSVKIVNLALLMLLNKKLDIRKEIKSIKANLYGVDLHWLPHVQGAIEIAKIIKEEHPESKIVFGGLSSTYFYLELMQNYPFIDFVLRGDSTEKYMRMLIDAVESREDYNNVPNLVWRYDNKIKENKFEPPEKSIDEVFLDYGTFIKNTIKTFGIKNNLPFKDWINNPTAITFIQKGCIHNCAYCGGCNLAYKKYYNRNVVSRRDPVKIVEELKLIKDYLGIPAFIVGDLNETSDSFKSKFFSELKKEGIDLPILFELFNPAPKKFYEDLSNAVNEFSIEISPDTSSEKIRSNTNKFYTNTALEKNIEYGRTYGAKKYDIFFSVGLPQQDLNSVLRDARYAGKLYKNYSNWLHIFISPLSPFIDPGSPIFEAPQKYGYKFFARTLIDHYNLLDKSNNWVDALNYETKWLSKKNIANATDYARKLFADIKKNIDKNNNLTAKELIENNNIKNYKKEELVWSKYTSFTKPFPIAITIYRKFNKKKI